MVGVPGKYKGCETCRRRRVKCTNERPFCQKCISSGRECEGYERERVFITGTPETKGRVASHPKKAGSSSKKQKASSSEPSPKPVRVKQVENPELVPLQPLTSAWDDHTVVSCKGIDYSVLVTALHTRLQAVLSEERAEVDAAGLYISMPPYAPPDLQPMPISDDFSVPARCLARLPGQDEGDDAESYFVFLFEHQMPISPWQDEISMVRAMGAAQFASFPNHHYFVRVYRPVAASLALLSRQDTFLSAPEWILTPWTEHPKSLLDYLFDLILLLPAIFAQTDYLKPMDATFSRRGRAQELLHSCLALEHRFNVWLQSASQGTLDQPLAYWAEELTSPGGLIPFTNSYTFKDGITGLSFLYYWMAQILFHSCIETLHRIIFQPVIDAYPNMWPDLPPDLQIDVTNYQHQRDFAAEICRGLDSTLDGTVQPDMLVAPMTVALEFYREINTASQDGMMEILWLDNFRARLIQKGQHIADVLQRQNWIEVMRF